VTMCQNPNLVDFGEERLTFKSFEYLCYMYWPLLLSVVQSLECSAMFPV
jgi:hypothetical protein